MVSMMPLFEDLTDPMSTHTDVFTVAWLDLSMCEHLQTVVDQHLSDLLISSDLM